MPTLSTSKPREIAVSLGAYILADPVLRRAYLAQDKRADEIHPLAAYPIEVIGVVDLSPACEQFHKQAIMIEEAISGARGFNAITTDRAASAVRRVAAVLMGCADSWADGHDDLDFDPVKRVLDDPIARAVIVPAVDQPV